MVPVSESHLLQIQWQVDYYQRDYKSKSVEYITHLLGHEGENSLLSFLINENLAYELTSSVSDNMRLYSNISIEITLTQYGQGNLFKVFHAVGEYLQLIKTHPVQKWVWDEMKAMKKHLFEFKEKSNPVGSTVLLSRKMSEYPIEDILISSFVMDVFDEV